MMALHRVFVLMWVVVVVRRVEVVVSMMMMMMMMMVSERNLETFDELELCVFFVS